MEQNHTYILVDASYYIFYRVFALVNWWKLSHKDQPITDLHENEEFLKRFQSVFHSKLKEIPKKLKLHKKAPYTFIIGRDCSRKDIWRSQIYPDYKGTRGDYSDAKVSPAPFFKFVYSTNLFEQTPDVDLHVLHHPTLEADDCLAITAKHISATQPDNQIYIITSDTDYLQLISPNIHLYTLKFKPVNTEKNSTGDPKKDLLYKIIIGDKSDNIPGVFPKCGPKRALAYVNNIASFEQDLIKRDAVDQYKLNRTLIDFDQIPQEMQQSILDQWEACT